MAISSLHGNQLMIQGCPHGMVTVPGNNYCYKYIPERMNWNSAWARCESEGLVLARTSDSTALALQKKIINTYGLLGKDSVYQFAWMSARGDGSALSWRSGPDDTGSSSGVDVIPRKLVYSSHRKRVGSNWCPRLNLNSVKYHPTIPYFISKCEWSFHVLCQERERKQRKCPEGFFELSNQCFKLYDDTRRNFWEAKAKCEAENLRLAEPRDPIALFDYLVENYEEGTRWTWLGAQGDGQTVNWLDGKNVDDHCDSCWRSGHPGNRVSTSFCLVLTSHKNNPRPDKPFFSQPCHLRNPILCEYTL